MKVVDLTLREFRNRLELAETLQLPHKIVRKITQQVFGLRPRLLGGSPRLLCLALRTFRALSGEDGEYRRSHSDYCQHNTDARDLPGPYQGAPRCELPLLLLVQQALSGFARFPFLAQVAAFFDDAAQHIMRELNSAYVEALLNAQQSPIHQQSQGARRRACGGEATNQALLSDILAES